LYISELYNPGKMTRTWSISGASSAALIASHVWEFRGLLVVITARIVQRISYAKVDVL